ncbi:exopolysaccharide Pel transporter PelG [Thermotoga sp. Mc24]|uniref:exopolysaccharide Pel transporter PelG n=1 Tax=Thermotoga sp. Mc24 TaxID=1231241 RepID=UPI0009DD9E7D|nr:exopolysaccharide Pel transporter PelG [Thermotoga sp. Mc24]
MAGKFFKLKFFRETFLGNFLTFSISAFESNLLWLFPFFFFSFIFRKTLLFEALFGVITYSFIFSTIVLGGLAFAIVRIISDFIYLNQPRKIYENYSGAVFLVFFVSLASGYIFFHDYHYREIAMFLFMGLSVLQVNSLFVGAIEKTYLTLFSVGASFSLVALFFNFFKNNINEKMGIMAFAMSISLSVFILNVVITKYLKSTTQIRFDFLKLIGKNPELLLIGYLYYLSYWIDNIVLWIQRGIEVAPGIVIYPDYDFPLFITSVSFIPSIVLINLNIETIFLEKYLAFFSSIKSNKPLNQIEENLRKLKLSIKHILFKVILVGITTLILNFSIAPFFKEWGILNENSILAFTVSSLGHFFNAVFVFLMIMCLYFGYYAEALKGNLIAFVVNFVVSWFFGKTILGIGFLVSFLSGSVFLLHKFDLKDLIFKIYSSQPHGLEKVKRISWKP